MLARKESRAISCAENEMGGSENEMGGPRNEMGGSENEMGGPENVFLDGTKRLPSTVTLQLF